MKTKSQQAYEMYAAGIGSWDDVAADIGLSSPNSAAVCARQYAKKHKLTWPLKHNGGPASLDEEAFDLRRRGVTYSRIARYLGYAHARAAQAAAERFAERNPRAALELYGGDA